MLKKLFKNLALACLAGVFFTQHTADCEPTKTQWLGKKVAFLGDSITDPDTIKGQKLYWSFLADSLGITPKVYGISGQRAAHIPAQARKLQAETNGDIDAILIFIGTNDFNSSIPLGQWFTPATTAAAEVCNTPAGTRQYRTLSKDPHTFRGALNTALEYIKKTFPDKQVVLLTPIHRSSAIFSKTNVQPDESYSNRLGLFIHDYVAAIKEATNIWAVPVIDLNSLCGLYPSLPAHAKYFANPKTDLLHPNELGHKRIAETLKYQLPTLPVY